MVSEITQENRQKGYVMSEEFIEEDVDVTNTDSDEEISEEEVVQTDVEEEEVDLDEVADTAIDVLQTILKPFDIGDVTIDEYDGDEGELILDITGDDLAVLIGRHGRTLDSIQFLVSSICRRRLGFRYPIVVDVEGYKSRQRQKLESLAKSTANRAVSQDRDISMRPMTPYERRIIHIALKDDGRVKTESEGEGSERHVVVMPL